jgi:hypothetical protein
MSDLISRLESATEGSRELDQDIFHALDLCQKLDDGTCVDYRAPAYSTSIDGAVSIILPGWRWKLAMTGVGKAAARVEMWTIHYVAHPLPAFVKAKGYLAPAAICAAALKARGL